MNTSSTAHVDAFARDHLPPGELWPQLKFTLPELQHPERLNAGHVLVADALSLRLGARPAVHGAGLTWSYEELFARSGQVANVLCASSDSCRVTASCSGGRIRQCSQPLGWVACDDVARQREYVQGGCNITGDCYLVDADGHFWFEARVDDLIVSSGYNIAGPEVPRVTSGHDPR